MYKVTTSQALKGTGADESTTLIRHSFWSRCRTCPPSTSNIAWIIGEHVSRSCLWRQADRNERKHTLRHGIQARLMCRHTVWSIMDIRKLELCLTLCRLQGNKHCGYLSAYKQCRPQTSVYFTLKWTLRQRCTRQTLPLMIRTLEYLTGLCPSMRQMRPPPLAAKHRCAKCSEIRPGNVCGSITRIG
jgi:hypothetical protein